MEKHADEETRFVFYHRYKRYRKAQEQEHQRVRNLTVNRIWVLHAMETLTLEHYLLARQQASSAINIEEHAAKETTKTAWSTRCGRHQSRRRNKRYRKEQEQEPEFLHPKFLYPYMKSAYRSKRFHRFRDPYHKVVHPDFVEVCLEVAGKENPLPFSVNKVSVASDLQYMVEIETGILMEHQVLAFQLSAPESILRVNVGSIKEDHQGGGSIPETPIPVVKVPTTSTRHGGGSIPEKQIPAVKVPTTSTRHAKLQTSSIHHSYPWFPTRLLSILIFFGLLHFVSGTLLDQEAAFVSPTPMAAIGAAAAGAALVTLQASQKEAKLAKRRAADKIRKDKQTDETQKAGNGVAKDRMAKKRNRMSEEDKKATRILDKEQKAKKKRRVDK